MRMTVDTCVNSNDAGSEFHVVGPAMAKLQGPVILSYTVTKEVFTYVTRSTCYLLLDLHSVFMLSLFKLIPNLQQGSVPLHEMVRLVKCTCILISELRLLNGYRLTGNR